MTAGVVAAHYLAVSLGYDAEVLADSPLFYGKFAETSGTTATDASGNSHDGTIVGTPTLGATKVMPSGIGSFTLDTTARRVTVANGSWMNTSAWTVEAWVRLNSSTSYHSVLNRDAGAASRGWAFYVKDGKLDLFGNATASSPTDHLGTTTLSTATNYHVAATFDGTTVVLYLNGSGDGSFTTGAGVNSLNGITVGTSLAGSGTQSFSLAGNIDHVAYYGTALSAGRIAAHYAAA